MANPIPNGEARSARFDNRILSLCGYGLTAREIQGHLEEMDHAEVSPTLISNGTDAVIEQFKAWQSRPLDDLYPVVYLDVLNVKMREQGRVKSRAVCVAAGITLGGSMEVLGLWTSANEGAEFWFQVLTELQNRGVEDIFIACVDDLKDFPQAIETVYPKTSVQLCIVHLVRTSLNYVSWKERRLVARDLKLIYRAGSLDEAEQRFADFAQQWDERYPSVSALWKPELAGRHPIFSVSAGDTQDHLHDQCRGIAPAAPAQCGQDARRVSKRRGRLEGHVSGVEKSGQKTNCRPWLEIRR